MSSSSSSSSSPSTSSSSSRPFSLQLEALPGEKAFPWLVTLLSAYFCFAISHHVYSLSVPYVLLFVLTGAYLPSYFRPYQYNGVGRAWPWFMRLNIWYYIYQFLFKHIAIVTPEEWDNTQQYIFACHPHGLLSAAHPLMMTDMCQFNSKVNIRTRRDLGASIIFSIPFFRELCLWWGCVDAGRRTAMDVLSRGFSMQVYPGGEHEQLLANPEDHVVVIKNRKGIFRLALQYNVPIVPVYAFGEDRIYQPINIFTSFRLWLVKNLRVAVVLFFGRWFTPLPYKDSLVLVLGHPVYPNDEHKEQDYVYNEKKKLWQVTHKDHRSFHDHDVEAFQKKYIHELNRLFEEHKSKYPGYEKAALRVI